MAEKQVSIRTLQRFEGKCISMGLAIPGAKLYCREGHNAINHVELKIQKYCHRCKLRGELGYWRFLDS